MGMQERLPRDVTQAKCPESGAPPSRGCIVWEQGSNKLLHPLLVNRQPAPHVPALGPSGGCSLLHHTMNIRLGASCSVARQARLPAEAEMSPAPGVCPLPMHNATSPQQGPLRLQRLPGCRAAAACALPLARCLGAPLLLLPLPPRQRWTLTLATHARSGG